MISCKRATELISKSQDEPLTVRERISLQIHLFVCEFCEQFSKQTKLIGETIRKISRSDNKAEQGIELNTELEEQKKKLKSLLKR